MIEFGSVCSGIEAASVAWEPLGWKAAWFAEIEPFPCAVLAHHYPDVPNLGDMTALPARILAGEVHAPTLFCGGTPCQAFSVAGLRKSLDDARGGLSLTFCEIANAIDQQRADHGKQPCIVLWENVPGVLSTKDNAFGCFLAGLAGESDALVPTGGKWSNAGCVFGPERAVAWRILDAQYFGVAQRRRRVFVVASARADFDPVKVLFEFDGLRRDSAPSREAGEEVTPTIRAGSQGGGAGHEARSGDKDELIVPHLAKCLTTGTGARFDPETETLPVTHSLRGEGCDASEDGTGRGTPIIACQLPTEGRDTSLSDALTCPQQAAVAVSLRGREGGATAELGDEVGNCLRASSGGGDKPRALTAMQVRRLTPVECARLQGFPDTYLDITYRGKPAADGPKYKALGNSWAVPNVRWIGRRIHAQLFEGVVW